MLALITYIRLVLSSWFEQGRLVVVWLRLFRLKPAGADVLDGLYLFAAEDEGRTEEPTPRKREKEKEKGRVAKSAEIPSSLVALGGITVLFFLASWFLGGLANIMRKYLGGFNSLPAIGDGEITPMMVSLVQDTGYLLAPIFLIVMVMAIVGNVVQVGLMFTLKPLAFDFSRIKLDPASIIRKIFLSRQVAINLIKTLLKVGFLGVIAYFIIAEDFLQIMRVTDMGVADSLQTIGYIAFKLAIIMSIVLLVMSVPDYFFQRYEFTESIKMTKEEVKQEMKETEGDPLVKQRQRQRALEVLRRNMFEQVREADVVITNPTHFAIALRYDESREMAPRVLAKGDDHLAFVIRNIAKREEISIVENKPLARELFYNVNEGEEVPEQFYKALVEIFVNLQGMKSRLGRVS